MKRFLKEASPRLEFWLIVTVAFGVFAVVSLVSMFLQRRRHIDDRYAIGLVAFELSVLLLVGALARLRGWSFRTLGLRPNWHQTVAGILLYFATVIALGLVYSAASLVLPASIIAPNIDGRGLSWLGVVLITAVNPLYEETLVSGYVIWANRREGAALAITASAICRFLYHTYQGPAAALLILPLGVLFAAIYWRYRQLWPLVVAHAAMDFIALWRLAAA